MVESGSRDGVSGAFEYMITAHTSATLQAFEQRIAEAWERGELPSLLHLCHGNEEQLLRIFQRIRATDWVFASHRAHYHALLKGLSEEAVERFIRSDASMFMYSREHRFYQSAILGGNCNLAVGVAYAIKQAGGGEHVWCFLGDGAEENGALYQAAMYATGHDLPVTFIVEDNNRQVDTDIPTRRGPKWHHVDFYAPCIERYHYESKWPHAGSGLKTQITFQRTYPLT